MRINFTALLLFAILIYSCKKDQHTEMREYFADANSEFISNSYKDSLLIYKTHVSRSKELYQIDSIETAIINLEKALNMIPYPKDQWAEYFYINNIKAEYLLYHEPKRSQKIYYSLLTNYKPIMSDSSLVCIYQNLAQLNLGLFKMENAHFYLDTAMNLVINDPIRLSELQLERGNIFYTEHELDSAIMQYKIALPNLAKDRLYNAYQNLCLFLVNDSMYEDSKKYLKYLLQNQSGARDLFNYYKLSGINEKLASNYNQAIEYLSRADSIATKNLFVGKYEHSDVLSELGHSMALMGNGEKALLILDNALKLTNDNQSQEYHNALLYKLKAYRILAETRKSEVWREKGLNLAEEIYSFLGLLSKTFSEEDILHVLTYFHDMYDDWLYLASQVDESYSSTDKNLLLFKIFKRRKDHLDKNLYGDYFEDLLELQDITQKNNATIVSYYLGHTNTFVFTINATDIVFKKLNHPNIIQSLIKSIDYSKENKTPFQMLYNYLIQPIEDHLSETIIIIPDNEISNVAFKYLIDSTGNSLLINHDLAYSTSISRCLKTDLEKLLDLNNVDITAFAYSNKSTLSKHNSSELPSSIREIDYFKSFSRSNLFYGTNSTKDNLFNYGSNASILHLALHGFSHSTDHNKNYLVFRKPNSQPDTLWAEEIGGFNNDLIVLSSCLSSSGTEYPVDGVYNLVKSFQQSGSEYIVSNLSVVDDKSMPKFMKEFYSNILNNNSLIKSFNLAQKNNLGNSSSTIRINI